MTAAPTDAVVLGLLAPPGVPEKLGRELCTRLPERLAERATPRRKWDVRFVAEARAHDARDDDDLVDVASEAMRREEWDLAVSLTDLPLDIGRRPLVAKAHASSGIVVISLPALGAVARRRRAVGTIVTLVEQVLDVRAAPSGDTRRDVRLASPPLRGHLRLLGGMVRANRPWRVVLDLSRALVAALSTAAYSLVTNTIWELGVALGPLRLTVFTLLSVLAMVVLLVIVHDLWEQPSGGLGREQAGFFNAATVTTLGIGAVCLYATLFALTLLVSGVFLDAGVVTQAIGHPAGLRDYAELAWFAASLATVGGTLGSGLEEHVDVREAAYSYHPERRR